MTLRCVLAQVPISGQWFVQQLVIQIPACGKLYLSFRIAIIHTKPFFSLLRISYWSMMACGISVMGIIMYPYPSSGCSSAVTYLAPSVLIMLFYIILVVVRLAVRVINSYGQSTGSPPTVSCTLFGSSFCGRQSTITCAWGVCGLIGCVWSHLMIKMDDIHTLCVIKTLDKVGLVP